jgi:hypothetical protein
VTSTPAIDSRWRTRALDQWLCVFLPGACAIALIASLPACSSSSSGHNADPEAGAPEASSPQPEASTPEASGSSETGGVNVANCTGLCSGNATTTFTCTSASAGDFTIAVVSAQSFCPNYAPTGTPTCSASQTTVNAAVNLNYLEFDCDGQVRSNQGYPCINEGSWSLSGSKLTFNVQQSGLNATCTKQ